MSIFWLGGKDEGVPFPEEKLKKGMWEDRFFKPGIIHGGDYLIRVYLNDSHSESEEYKDHNQFEVEYISKDLIHYAAKEDPLLDERFNELISTELESFCVKSTHEDFAEIVKCWNEAVPMNNRELLIWANS